MHDAASVKARLLNNLEPFLLHLLPAGKFIGHEFRVGSLAGEEGKSLAVEIRGEKAGVWQDFATGDKGDIFDLWCRVKNESFAEAFPKLCAWVGISDIQPAVKRVKPAPPPLDGLGGGSPEVRKYLTQVRGIADTTLKLYRVRSHSRQSAFNTDFWAAMFWDSVGAPVMLKSTGIKQTPDGRKDIWTTAPYYTLWGWWLVNSSHRSIIITEGEIDAMSVHQLQPGMPVLSMPSGAQNLTWIDNDYTALLRFERIYICTDSDEAGDKAAKEIATRLGLTRCMRLPVPLGYKDANQCLTMGQPEHLEISSWFEKAFSYDPPTLRGADSFTDDVCRMVGRWDEEERDKKPIFPDVDFTVRGGECTLIYGITGHGKSELTYQMLLHEMKNGQVCLIGSFEIEAPEMLANLLTQLVGHPPSQAEIKKFMPWFAGKLYFYSPKGEIRNNWPSMFQDFEYAAKRYGVKRFAIDSLLFVVPKDDYDAQDQFCVAIRDFNRANEGTHCFLLAHATTKKAEAIPTLSDITGSGGIPAPFSNILVVWRNHEDQEKLEEAKKAGNTTEVAKLSKIHDGLLIIMKNRRKGKRVRAKLWFDPKSRTFRTHQETPPAPSTDELQF